MTYQIYNLTNFTTENASFLTLAQNANDLVNGWIGITILASVFITIIISLRMKGYDIKQGFVASAWVNMLVAILLYPMSLISGIVMVGSIIMAGFSLLFLFIFSGN